MQMSFTLKLSNTNSIFSIRENMLHLLHNQTDVHHSGNCHNLLSYGKPKNLVTLIRVGKSHKGVNQIKRIN